MTKSNSAFAPLLIFGVNIFREKNDLLRLAYLRMLGRIGLGGYERELRRSVWWGNRDPAATRDTMGSEQVETKTVHTEAQASVLVPDEECDVLKRQIRVSSVQRKDGPGGPK